MVPQAAEKPDPKQLVTWGATFAVVVTVFLYVAGQLLAMLLLSIYPGLKGWSEQQFQNWFNDSVNAKFIYFLLVDIITVGFLWQILRYKKSGFRALGLIKPRLKDLPWAILGFIAYYIILRVVFAFVQHYVPSVNLDQKQDLGFDNAQGSDQLLVVFASLVLLPPFFEELLVRGFLFTGLRKQLPWVWAGLITSALFAAAHLEFGNGAPLVWVAAIDTFCLSLVLVYLRQKTGSLWPGIVVHMLKNGIAFYYIYFYAVMR